MSTCFLAGAVAAEEQPLPGPAATEAPLPRPAGEGPEVAPATAVPSAGISEPLWELGFGFAAIRFPDYRGSDQFNLHALPLPFIAYRGRFLRADRDGARAILFAGRRIEVDVSLAAAVPTDSDANQARSGMPDLPGSFEIGPNLSVELWQSADRMFKLDLRLPVRAAVTLESSPHGIGVTFSPNLNFDVRSFTPRWNLGLLAGPLFADQRHHEHYYGVAPEFATASRPAYRAPGGYAGWRATASFSRRLGNAWLGAFVRYDDLDGAVFEASPLLRRERSVTAGFGIAWIFAVSSERVVSDD